MPNRSRSASIIANLFSLWTVIAVAAICVGSANAAEPGCAVMKGINLPLAFRGGKGGADLAARWAYMDPQQRATINKQLTAVRADGFNTVRVVIDAVPLLASDDPRALLGALHDFSGAANEAGLCAVFSLALPGWNPRYSDKSMLRDPAKLDRYRALLSEVAQHVSQNVREQTFVETLNEPSDECGASAKAWPNVQVSLYQALERAAPTVGVIVSGTCWSTLKDFDEFDPAPYRADPEVRFTIHFYEPEVFAEQGAPKRCPFPELRSVPYPAAPDCEQRAEAATAAAIESDIEDKSKNGDCLPQSQHMIADYCARQGNRQWIARRFDLVAAWAAQNGVAPSRILVGEFGATGGDVGAERPDRLRWLKDVHDQIQQKGLSWLVWGLTGRFNLQCASDGPGDQGVCPDMLRALEMN